jgi:hypothetical protein
MRDASLRWVYDRGVELVTVRFFFPGFWERLTDRYDCYTGFLCSQCICAASAARHGSILYAQDLSVTPTSFSFSVPAYINILDFCSLSILCPNRQPGITHYANSQRSSRCSSSPYLHASPPSSFPSWPYIASSSLPTRVAKTEVQSYCARIKSGKCWSCVRRLSFVWWMGMRIAVEIAGRGEDVELGGKEP